MAVSLYCGVPGSGKSYEVVAFVILPALAKGRRVVTNIAGFDELAAREYLMSKEKVAPGDIGAVVLVDDDEVTKAGFFPAVGARTETVVRPGDLVVIDEAWKFWGSDSVVSEEALDFFRKHRHLTHAESGVSCDLVVVAQEPSSLHRKIRGVIELSFRAKKLKTVGLNSSYTVHMWEGPNQRRKPISTQTKRYNKEIFPLYSSYSGSNGAAGREMVVDGRQNVFKRGSFWIGAIVVLCMFVFGVSYAVKFFNGGGVTVQKRAGEGAKSANEASFPSADRFGDNAGAETVKRGLGASMRQAVPVSKVWRLAGFLSFAGRVKVLLIDGSGRIRYAGPSDFVFQEGRPTSGVVDGERVTPWSGVPVGGSGQPVQSSSVPVSFGAVQ